MQILTYLSEDPGPHECAACLFRGCDGQGGRDGLSRAMVGEGEGLVEDDILFKHCFSAKFFH